MTGSNSGVTNNGQTSFEQYESSNAEANAERLLEEEYASYMLQNVEQVITNKFPTDHQFGKEYIYQKGSANQLIVQNGVREMDFIIDLNGNLHIGKGHSFLANRADVQAAGRIKIGHKRRISAISNESGHYRPSVQDVLNYHKVFSNAGFDISEAWINVYSVKTTKSGYSIPSFVVYSGKVSNLRRKLH